MKKESNIFRLLSDPKSIVGALISFIGIYYAFKDFQFIEFKSSIYDIKYYYVLIATLFLWLSVWLRAVRWKYLFTLESFPTIVSLYRAEMIGYFGNNILPLRFGEFLRSYLISKEWNLSKGYVFGTVVLERLLDTLCLLFLSFLLIVLYPIDQSLRMHIMWWGGYILLAIVLIFILLYLLRTIRTNNKIVVFLKKIIEGFPSINKNSIFPITVVSILIWGIYLLDVYLLQCAFSFKLSFNQTLMVLVLSSLAMALPSAPGMIGTYHLAVKYTVVDLFGYSIHDGNSFAIVMHAYAFILFTSFGGYYFLKNQFHKKAISFSIEED